MGDFNVLDKNMCIWTLYSNTPVLIIVLRLALFCIFQNNLTRWYSGPVIKGVKSEKLEIMVYVTKI